MISYDIYLLSDSISVSIDPHKNKIHHNGKIRLVCTAEGYPTPDIEWQKMGKRLRADRRIHIHKGQLTIRNATTEDTGMYTCIASNQAEQVKKSTSIHVAPRSEYSLVSYKSVLHGHSV